MSEAVTPNPVLTGGICTPASIEVGTRSNPTATYPPLAIGGAPLPTTIMSGGAPVLVVNPAGPFVPIPGVPINPLTIPSPFTLPRTRIEPRQNTSVYFNGILVPVHNDQIVADGASPERLRLTGVVNQPTILIGTQTYTPAE